MCIYLKMDASFTVNYLSIDNSTDKNVKVSYCA